MNITIAVDEVVVEKARELARRQGRSLQELVREYLHTLVGERSGEVVADELFELMNTHGGHSGGCHIGRAAAYENRFK